MDSFYVILPSNTPIEDNITSNFTIRLPNVLDLSEGEWTVALSSIIYPISYHSDVVEEMFITFEYYDEKTPDKKIPIPNNVFKSVKHLEKTINDSISSVENVVKSKNRPKRDVVHPFDVPLEFRRNRVSLNDNNRRNIDNLNPEQIKTLNSARSEVIDRSFKITNDILSESEDLIVDIERIIARVEFDCYSALGYTHGSNEEYDRDELDSIKKEIEKLIQNANLTRDDAQAQRERLVKFEIEYGNVINDIEIPFETGKVYEAKKVADRAKNVTRDAQALKMHIERLKNKAEDYLIQSKRKYDILASSKQILDESLKLNMNRVQDLIINSLSVEQLKNLGIYFYYDDNTGKFFLYNHQKKKIKSVRLTKHLAYLLGFEREQNDGAIKGLKMRRGGGFAKYTPDISGGIHQLYIYLPRIIENTYLGNSQVPLLRIINVEKEPGQMTENIYTQEHHHRIVEKRISNIQIQIRSSSGEFIKFNWGDVIITLHFKRSLF
jgi:hypothetical protein